MTQTPPSDAGILAASPPVTVAANVQTSIPYPTNTPQQLSWVVVNNSSPFTVLVTQGQVLGMVAAFTADAFPVRSGQPLGLLPFPTSALVSPGTDSTVYALWYQSPPGGSYPSALGAGTTPLTQQNTTTTTAIGLSGTVDLSAFVLPWMESLVVRFVRTGGTASAISFNLVAATGEVLAFPNQLPVPFSTYVYVPIHGQKCVLNWAGLLAGTTFGGLIEIWAMPEHVPPAIVPVSDTSGGVATTQLGLTVDTAVAAGTTAGMIGPFLVTFYGYSVRLRAVSWRTINTPAAAAAITFHTAGATFFGDVAKPAAGGQAGGPGACDLELPIALAGGLASLECQNASSVQITASALYDIIPQTLG